MQIKKIFSSGVIMFEILLLIAIAIIAFCQLLPHTD